MGAPPLSVFTEQYPHIMNKIINAVVVINTENNLTVPATSLWDTGATGTCISYELAQKLHLTPIGFQCIQTPSGSAQVKQYKVHIVLNQELVVQDVTVFDSEIGQQGLDVLIGMDIISLGDFAISNYKGTTQFSFRIPSQEHVDYRGSGLYIEDIATTSENNIEQEDKNTKEDTN